MDRPPSSPIERLVKTEENPFIFKRTEVTPKMILIIIAY